jgi:hypothetical protein
MRWLHVLVLASPIALSSTLLAIGCTGDNATPGDGGGDDATTDAKKDGGDDAGPSDDGSYIDQNGKCNVLTCVPDYCTRMQCVPIVIDGSPWAQCQCPDPEAGIPDGSVIPCGALDCVLPCVCTNFKESQCTCTK